MKTSKVGKIIKSSIICGIMAISQFSFAQCNVQINMVEQLCQVDTITIQNPTLSSINDFSFSNIPSEITGGTLIIFAQGDLDNSYENWDIFDENSNIIGSIGGTGGPCDLIMIEIPLSAVDLVNWGMNGSIDFQAIDVSGTDINTNLCGDDFVQMILEICSPPDCNGTVVNLEAIGTGSTSIIFEEDFDAGYGAGWLAQPPGVLTNPCDPSIDGGDYLWVGGTASPRNVTTIPLNVSCGGEICFYLDFAIQGENPPCEGSDLATEGVYLEYSTDGGSIWSSIEYYGPAGVGNNTDPDGYDPIMTTWNQYCVTIPQAAYTSNTLFRWSQQSASTPDNDQWGIDNVVITVNDYCDPYTYDWSQLPGSNNPAITVDTANATYTYVVTYSNGIETCMDSVTVIIPDGIYVEAGDDGLICDGVGAVNIGGSPSATGGLSGVFNYSWAPIDGLSDPNSSNPNAQPLVTTTYTLSVVDGNGCSETDQVTVVVGTSPNVSAGDDETICEGESVQLTASGANNYVWNPNQYLNSDTLSNVIATPPVTTNYQVTGYSSEGCFSSDIVTVIVEPGPSIDAGLDQSICIGETAILNASGAPGTSFSWDNNVQNGVPFSPVVTSSYVLTGTSLNGCVSTDTVVIYVNPLPQINSADQLVCQGEVVNLTASGANSYSWQPGTYLNQTTGSIVQCTPEYGISYLLIGTDLNGCVDSIFVNVDVNPTPDPFISGAISYCIGGQSTLSASQVYSSYSWSTGANTQSIIVTEANNPISLTVTNSYGCSATAGPVNVVEDTIIITENYIQICEGDQVLIHGNMESTPGQYSATFSTATSCDSTSNVTLDIIPNPPVSAGPDVELCFGEYFVPNGTGGFNLSWDSGIVDGQAFVPTIGVHQYILTGENEIGCISTDTILVTVNDLPTISAGPDLYVCEGDAVTLNATGAISYEWDNGVFDGQSFVPSLGNTVYTVVGTDLNGCKAQDFMILVVNPIPVIYAGTDVDVCDGNDIVLTGSGGTSYQWNNSVTDGETFVPTISGEYIVNGTDVNGCSNSDTLLVNILQVPNSIFTTNEVSGCRPLVVELQDISTGNIVDCFWDIEGYGTINNCGNQTIEFNESGDFDISLTVVNDLGCSSTMLVENAVQVYDLPEVVFYPSSYAVSTLNTQVIFNNISVGAISYVWNFNDGSFPVTTESPIHNFPDAEDDVYIVQLIGTSSLGCSDTMTLAIDVYEELIFYVPNSFTPDNDEYNELFQPVFTSGYDPSDFNLYVYNRWGELIFESHDASKGWKGTYGYGDRMVETGTYTWKIVFKSTTGDDRHEVYGHVNVLR